MKVAEVLKQLDDIAEALVMTDPEVVEPLEQLLDKFGDLAAFLREMEQQDCAEASQAAIAIATKTLSGQLDWPVGMDILSRTCNALQACLNEDCPYDEAGFPGELTSPPVPVESAPREAPTPSEAMVDESIVIEFLNRQADTLADVEELLLGLKNGGTPEEKAWIMRFFHTLKGESSLLGMSEVADLCHATEDMMQGKENISCVDGLLDVKDWFIQYFKHYAGEGPAPQPLPEILEKLGEGPEEVPAGYEVVPYIGMNILEGDLELVQDFIEEAVEHLDAAEVHLLTLEADSRETEALNAVFRGFHTIKGLAGFIELNHVKDLAHKAENLLDLARRGDLELVGKNMDLVFESVDMMKNLVGAVAAALGGDGLLPEEEKLPGLMGRLLEATSGESRPAEAARVPEPEPEPEPPAASAPKSGFIPLSNMKKKAAKPDPAVAKGVAPAVSASGKAKAPVKLKEAVRVDAERLDHLVETIGELVIAESMVSQSPEMKQTALSVKLAKDLDHLDKICRELQEIGMSLRMVPVRPVFQKMARLVRDLSKKQKRQVEFVMSGEDTELDKNVVDKIGDPLVHMVRNSVDHGIEPDVADRLKSGKPEKGRVELRAFHKGGNICIEIEDDGRGLDKEAILEKAISRGLVREGEKLSDREIFNMIFEAGFSTAKQVTEVSGRGVGMDVVRRNIEELRGTVDISSEKGKGSVFSIKLPLTLAIIEGMVVMVGQEHYIIPTLSVVRLIRPRRDDLTHVFDKGEMLAFEGSHLPLFRLGRLFDVEGAKTEPEEAMVVVVEEEGKQIGIMADQLLGQQSIVIKSLGETVQGTDGVAGGAIMSDGNVALILDVAGLVRVAHSANSAIGGVTTRVENMVTENNQLPV